MDANSCPTAAQIALAHAWGITTDGLTARELSSKLHATAVTRGMEALTSNPALCEGKTIKYAEACFVVAAIHRNPRNPSVSLRPVNGGRTKVVRAASLLDAQEVKQDTIQPTPEHPAVIALRETIMSMRNEGIWRTLPDELEAFANEGAAVLAD